MSHRPSHPPAVAPYRRLVVPAPPSPRDVPLPLFLRAPWIAALWGLTLLTLVAGLALGRVRVPRVVAGVAVAVPSASDSVTLLLLLPPSSGQHARPGHRATLDGGRDGAFTVTITAVEHDALDSRSARRRFAESPSVLAYLGTPRLVARLERCTPSRCLAPAPGTSFAALASLGSRTLASYVTPRS